MTDSGKGKFTPGKSGNARGRPKKKEPEVLSTPEDLAMVIMRVANRRTTVRIEGCDEVVTVFEANTIGMASGNGPARHARKAFVDLAKSASYTVDRHKKRQK